MTDTTGTMSARSIVLPPEATGTSILNEVLRAPSMRSVTRYVRLVGEMTVWSVATKTTEKVPEEFRTPTMGTLVSIRLSAVLSERAERRNSTLPAAGVLSARRYVPTIVTVVKGILLVLNRQ